MTTAELTELERLREEAAHWRSRYEAAGEA